MINSNLNAYSAIKIIDVNICNIYKKLTLLRSEGDGKRGDPNASFYLHETETWY